MSSRAASVARSWADLSPEQRRARTEPAHAARRKRVQLSPEAEQRIAALVAEWPEFTPEQRVELSAIFRRA